MKVCVKQLRSPHNRSCYMFFVFMSILVSMGGSRRNFSRPSRSQVFCDVMPNDSPRNKQQFGLSSNSYQYTGELLP